MSSARSGKGHHGDADAGSRDDRNLLVTVIAKVARALEPSIIVVENVPAFLTRRVRHPRDEEPVSAAVYLISALSRRYQAFPLLADLSSYGVPQSRNRSFLTFIRRDHAGLRRLRGSGRAPYPRPTHGVDGDARPVTLDEALQEFALPSLDAASAAAATVDGYGGLHSVPVWDERTYTMVSAIPAASGASAWENQVCLDCGPIEVEASAAVCPTCGRPLLRPVVREKDGSYRLIRGFKTSYRRMKGDRPAATITTASGHIGSDNSIHPNETRLLSTLECALLQTFPRDFVWGEALNKWGHTNARSMIGEAVPPKFTRQHGQVLRSVLDGQWTSAPIALSDDRVTLAWDRLAAAAARDSRRLPRFPLDAPRSRAGRPLRDGKLATKDAPKQSAADQAQT